MVLCSHADRFHFYQGEPRRKDTPPAISVTSSANFKRPRQNSVLIMLHRFQFDYGHLNFRFIAMARCILALIPTYIVAFVLIHFYLWHRVNDYHQIGRPFPWKLALLHFLQLWALYMYQYPRRQLNQMSAWVLSLEPPFMLDILTKELAGRNSILRSGMGHAY